MRIENADHLRFRRLIERRGHLPSCWELCNQAPHSQDARDTAIAHVRSRITSNDHVI